MKSVSTRNPMFSAVAGLLLIAPLVACNENVTDEGNIMTGGGGGAIERDPVETLNPSLLASVVAGARIYDKWYDELGLTAPTTLNPMSVYADSPSGFAADFAGEEEKSYRCKSCHGWTYEGDWGFPGVLETAGSMTKEEIMDAIGSGFTFQVGTTGPETIHNFADLGLTDQDLEDLANFIIYGVLDTSAYIYSFGAAKGDAVNGKTLFDTTAGCAGSSCHGADGKKINFGAPTGFEYVGTIGQDEPDEMLHTIRFGHAGDFSMPALYDDPQFTTQDAADILTYTQQLPAN